MCTIVVLLQVKEKSAEDGYRVGATFESKFRHDKKKVSAYAGEEYHKSTFIIEPRGSFVVPKDAYMPNVRNIPSFPLKKDPGLEDEGEMLKGDTWSAPGFEVMNFGTLVAVPLDVSYEYAGAQTVNTKDGVKTLHKIVVNYNINHELPKSKPKIPEKMFGYATAVYFWDEDQHMPYYAQEDYNLLIMYRNGQSSEFQIKSKSVYRKIKRFGKKKRQKITKNLGKKFKKVFKKNAPKIKDSKEGVRITLPGVLFKFNSSSLTDKSQELLDQVIEVLGEYKDLRIQVQGHTDNIGKESYNKKLSEARAKSVVDYVIAESEIKSERLSYQGFGSSKPVASNKKATGRKQNRRVEFLILE